MSKSRVVWGVIFTFLLCLTFCLTMPANAQIGVRVLLGVTDETSVNWDGSVTADGVRVTRLDPWRFGKEDELNRAVGVGILRLRSRFASRSGYFAQEHSS